jgi:hypothetical protein
MRITNATTKITYVTKVFLSRLEPGEYCATVTQENVEHSPVIDCQWFTCRHKARRHAIDTARALGEAMPCV